jgi:hypothetical protein
MSDGTEQPQAWSAWNTTACYIGEVSRRTDTQTAACPTGYTGNQTRTQVVIVMSNGTEQPQGWSAWNTSACVQQNVIVETRTYRTESLAICGSGSGVWKVSTSEIKDRWTNGSITSRGVTTSNGTCLMFPMTTMDVRAYSNCGSFGGQSYVLNRYQLAMGRPNAAFWFLSQVGSAGCGWY